MPTFLEQLAPPTLRQPLLILELARPFDRRRAFSPVLVSIKLDPSLRGAGVVLPLEEILTGPKGLVRRRMHRLVVPKLVTFMPREGGSYQVLLREVAHNLHYGLIAIDVEGSSLLP